MKTGLIARALGHSFSPEIHAMIGGYEYGLYPMEPEDVEGFVKSCPLSAFNVTIPYKETVLPFLTRLTPQAQDIGAVNTVLVRGEERIGCNTDYDGFRRLLGQDAEHLRRKPALVLGSGGASKAVCAVLRDLAIPFTVISRSGKDNYENISRHKDASLIVNATPVGMYPAADACPVDLSLFPRLELALDLIYNPLRTRFLLAAEARGIPARNGLLMLTAQAVRAAELFTGETYSPSLPEDIARAIWKRRENIVLIGMPGAGKSTVGRILADILGREFFDTDEMILSRAGASPAEILAARGEPAFRKIETDCLREASSGTGRVIAAGGGIVTVPENRDILRQNGRAVYLARPIASLDTTDRPLTREKGVEALFRERRALYEAWGEIEIQNDAPENAARRIREELAL